MDETKLENEQETSVSSDTRYTANPIRVTRRNFLRSSAVGSAVAIGGPLACTPAPVDEHGNFVAEAVLPTGLHTVEVAVLDPAGKTPSRPAAPAPAPPRTSNEWPKPL